MLSPRESMLQTLQDSPDVVTFNEVITDAERATITAADLNPDPWRARTPHATGPDLEYLTVDNFDRVVKTPLRQPADHGLVLITDPVRLLQIMLAEAAHVRGLYGE